MSDGAVIEISGAGPAGLAAALAVRRVGGTARVYERRANVGLRFHGDFQGLENWTTQTDVLDELQSLDIESDFEYTPFREVVCFDPDGVARTFRSERPLFYLVRRGSGPGTLDSALREQACRAGAEIHFGEPVSYFPQGGIVTEGPHRADVVAAGYVFETGMADGAYAAISDRLAPKGYAYLLICKGRGTLATCLFEDFHNEREYLERCVDFFSRGTGVRMTNPRRFGGGGNFSLPRSACKGNILYAGEAAGFQDPLFGFGMRWALVSGAAAGQALVTDEPEKYERFWHRRLCDFQQTAATNRWFYDRLGDRGYRFVLRRFPEGGDVREWLGGVYRPRWWKRLWYRLIAERRYDSVLTMHENCDCTWCRCGRHVPTASAQSVHSGAEERQ